MRNHPVPYEQLIAYAADELDGPEAAAVAAHLDACTRCTATVVRFRAARSVLRVDDGEMPPPATLTRAKALFIQRRHTPEANWLQRVIAALAFDSRSGLALSGARGVAGGYQLGFESSVADVDLELEPPEKPISGRWQLLGQVVAHENAPVTTVGLAPVGASTPIAQTDADEHGFFSLHAAPGRYNLLVTLPTVLLVLPDIEIG
ncbi:MAG TPA: hypothetical protein DEP84_30405 [Chloroflexi bacterium]|nr:hypothetical protein [Chloroflexota bacterium]